MCWIIKKCPENDKLLWSISLGFDWVFFTSYTIVITICLRGNPVFLYVHKNIMTFMVTFIHVPGWWSCLSGSYKALLFQWTSPSVGSLQAIISTRHQRTPHTHMYYCKYFLFVRPKRDAYTARFVTEIHINFTMIGQQSQTLLSLQLDIWTNLIPLWHICFLWLVLIILSSKCYNGLIPTPHQGLFVEQEYKLSQLEGKNCVLTQCDQGLLLLRGIFHISVPYYGTDLTTKWGKLVLWRILIWKVNEENGLKIL